MDKINKQEFTSRLRYKISKGYVKSALEELNQFPKSNDLSFVNDAILTLNKLVELRRNLSNGVISYEEYQMNHSRIVYSTLQLLDEIEESFTVNFENIDKVNTEKEQIKKLLILFERAVFNAPSFGEHSTLMLEAFRTTRIALQMNGATLLENLNFAMLFKEIIDQLQRIEFDVRIRFPDVETALRKGVDESNYHSVIIPNNMQAVAYMVKERGIINEIVEEIKYRYGSL